MNSEHDQNGSAMTQGTQGSVSGAISCVPRDYQQMMHFCEKLSRSNAVPKSMAGDPMTIFLCIEMGGRLGYSIFQSLQNIAVINGKPQIYGDEPLARVRRSRQMEYIKEHIEGTGDAMEAVCVVKRVNEPEVTRVWTVADAKAAGKWKASGPWTQYPKRMMQMKARNHALRDVFTDVLGGAVVNDELEAPAPRVAPKPAPDITGKAEVVETPLGQFLRTIASAKKLDELDAIAQQAAELTAEDAAKARPAFAARQKELRTSSEQKLSKAQRIMQKRLAEGQQPLDDETADLFAAEAPKDA